MFLGHALLAFAVAALVAHWRGWSGHRALTVGVVAGAFGAIPDVDIAYAAITLNVGEVAAAADPEAFWDATRGVHRTITHSIVVAVPAAAAFGLWAVRARDSPATRWAARGVAVLVLAALVGVAYAASGLPGGVVMGMFALAGLAVATAGTVATDLRPHTVALAAVAALLSHPWGDLLTGAPPGLFYPFEAGVIGERVLLHGDPTVHLLGAFAVELAAVWLAALAVVRISGPSWRELVDRRAAVGVAYGTAAVVLTPPTLAVSYQFVFSIVPVGVVCGGLSARSIDLGLSGRNWTPFRPPFTRPERGDLGRSALRVVLTALAGITVALASYAAVYLLSAAV